ncbi:hypothetical protein E5161_12185 [Cohnella pontilimi]|uniref:Uncharacterized protein n=1 Tax=Cohnella pontilimi TaxID=2564100 RepID=A0A4V5LSE5_9BACL|nr:DUF6470 family protein [Cohnella pontilimi]TJY41949.1 hypothetical protein E5161_12185 [Cohnella pontilimi]
MISQISIHSQRGMIGIESQPGRYEITSKPAEIRAETHPPVMTADNGPGELVIDQSRTWDALNGGKPEAFNQRYYSQFKNIGYQNIENIVEKGNRMGDLRVKGNPIAQIALEEYVKGPPALQIFGFASPDNVDISFIPRKLNLQVEPGSIRVDIQTHSPDIQFQRGAVKVYMAQYPSVTITPPTIDIMT